MSINELKEIFIFNSIVKFKLYSLENIIEKENDRNNISLIILYKIFVVLGVRIDKFFEE